MREVLSIRFAATIAALVGLAAFVWFIVPDHSTTLVPTSSGLKERRIDFVSLVFSTTAQQGFAIKDGKTTKKMELVLDSTRRIRIPEGTPGEVTCPKMGEFAQCAVAADLLGESVLWFALVPAPPRQSLPLPPVVEVRKNNDVLLANGWVVKRSSTVDRVCRFDTDSLDDFLTRFGDRSTSTFSYDRQQIVRVTCAGDAADVSTVPTEDTVSGSTPPGADTLPNEGTDTLPPGSVVVGTGVPDIIEVTPPPGSTG
ncbi:MAG: hypothetical protein V9E89_08125 [Ilumatobacteraceae bacterium]